MALRYLEFDKGLRLLHEHEDLVHGAELLADCFDMRLGRVKREAADENDARGLVLVAAFAGVAVVEVVFLGVGALQLLEIIIEGRILGLVFHFAQIVHKRFKPKWY